MRTNFFENLKYFHLQKLINLINDSEEKKTEFIERSFSAISNNFRELKVFLNELKLLSEDKGVLKISSELQFGNDDHFSDSKLKRILVDRLLKSEFSNKTDLKEYLNNFNEENSYCYYPGKLQRIKHSEIRNFLIELNLIEYDRTLDFYRIQEKQLKLFETYRRDSKFSQKELDKILKKQKEIGLNAELEVVEYEKKRLSSQPDLVKKIKHIANDDVSAGYDILSWEIKNDKGEAIPRYIEVKAVSEADGRFFWSQNEVEKAKHASKKYFLYLLPVKSENEYCIEDIDIIQDPAVKILDNPEKWNTKVEKYEITKNN